MRPHYIHMLKKRPQLPLKAAIIGLSIILQWHVFSQVHAAPLTNVAVLLSNDLPYPHRSYFTIFFTTATAGAIKTIDMFPLGGTGTEIVGASLVEVQGIGAGVSSVGGGVFTYTVDNAVNVPAGARIKFVIADMPNLSPNPDGGAFRIYTKDTAGTVIDEGFTQYALRKIQPGGIATDVVTGNELAGVNNIKFGTCRIDPPRIRDNSHRYLHLEACPLGLSGSANVIAFPGVFPTATAPPGNEGLHARLVPKGSFAHCPGGGPCHLDVVIRNTAPPDGGVDDGPQVWAWIAWN